MTDFLMNKSRGHSSALPLPCCSTLPGHFPIAVITMCWALHTSAAPPQIPLYLARSLNKSGLWDSFTLDFSSFILSLEFNLPLSSSGEFLNQLPTQSLL